MRSYNIGGILRFDMGIEDAIGFNHNIGALLAKAMTAGEVDLRLRSRPVFPVSSLEGFIDQASLTSRDSIRYPGRQIPYAFAASYSFSLLPKIELPS